MIYREKELPRSKVPDKVKREGIQSTGRQNWPLTEARTI